MTMKDKLKNIKKYFFKLIRRLKNYLNIFLKKLINYLKTNLMVEIFIIVNIINGILVRYFTVNNQFAIKPILGDLTLLIAISAFCYFFKPKKQIRYLFIWSIIFVLRTFNYFKRFSNFVFFIRMWCRV